MFCPNCGNEAGNARFCRSCGTNLTVVSDVLEGSDPSRLRTTVVGRGTTFNLFHPSRVSNENDLNGHSTVSVFGATQIDLTAAPLAAGETRISVVSIFGGAEIRVPDDVAVRITGVSIFGGIKVRRHSLGNGLVSVNDYETPGYAQSTLRLHIDAVSIFGGMKVRH